MTRLDQSGYISQVTGNSGSAGSGDVRKQLYRETQGYQVYICGDA